MFQNNMDTRKKRFDFTKLLGVLLICCTILFAFTLAFAVNGTFSSIQDNGAPLLAEAATAGSTTPYNVDVPETPSPNGEFPLSVSAPIGSTFDSHASLYLSKGSINYYSSNSFAGDANGKIYYVKTSKDKDYRLYIVINYVLTSEHITYLLLQGATLSVEFGWTNYNYNGDDIEKLGLGVGQLSSPSSRIHASSVDDSIITWRDGSAGEKESKEVSPITKTFSYTSANIANNKSFGFYIVFAYKMAPVFLGMGSRAIESAIESVTLNVKLNVPTTDTGNPKTTVATYSPDVTSIGSMPVNFGSSETAEMYTKFPSLLEDLKAARDNTVYSSSHYSQINLLSYTKTKWTENITVDGSNLSIQYYKKLSLTFTEYSNPSSTGGIGFKEISINGAQDADGKEYGADLSIGLLANNTKTVLYYKDGSTTIATIIVTKVSNTSYKADIYFAANTINFTINFSDYYNNHDMTVVNVKGIDPAESLTAQDVNLEDFICKYSQGYNSIAWYYDNTMKIENEYDVDDEAAPILFYYSLYYKASDMPSLSTDKIVNQEYYAYKNASALQLTFTNSGYYIVEFGVRNLTGATSTADNNTRYLIKVDLGKPDYTKTVKLTGKSDDWNFDSNGWLNNPSDSLTIKLTINDRVGNDAYLSGNTLFYVGSDENDHYLVVDGGVIVSSDGFGTLTNAGTTAAVYDDGVFRITYSNGVFTIVCGDRINNNRHQIINLDVTFYVNVGLDPTYEDVRYPSGADAINELAKIRIDKNAPSLFAMYDEGEENTYLADKNNLWATSLTSFKSPIDRVWWTEGWAKEFSVKYEDNDYLDELFGQSIMLYFGIAVNKFVPGFNASAAYAEAKSAGMDFVSYLNSQGYFDSIQSYSSAQVGGEADLNINLVSGRAGLRNIYVWVVDQAGNVSDTTFYQILVDAFDYNFNAQLYSDMMNHFIGELIVGDNIMVEIVDEEGNTRNTFKRGEYVFFNIVWAPGFVPYRIWTENNPSLYFDDTLDDFYSQSKFQEGSGITVGDTVVSSDGTKSVNFTTFIDSTDIFVEVTDASNITYTFSFRKTATLDINNSTSVYAGVAQDIPYIVTVQDDNYERWETPVTYNNSSGFTCFRGTYYYYDNATQQKGDMLASRPVNVGTYFVEARVNGDYYVSEGVEAIYSIVKNDLVVTANDLTVDYTTGTIAPLLDYTLEGLVGDDEENGYPVYGTFEGSLRLQGAPSLSGVNAGTYSIIQATAFTASNYNVTFIPGTAVINKRVIEIDVYSAQKYYGDTDPYFDFSVLDGQTDFNPDGSVYTIDKAYVLSLIQSGSITRAAGENVGEYEFNTDGLIISENYIIDITADSESRFTIVQRVVVITPVSGQRGTVETLEGDYFIPSGGTLLYSVAPSDAAFTEYFEGSLVIKKEGDDYVIVMSGGGLALTVRSDMVDNIAIVLNETPVYYEVIVAEGDMLFVSQIKMFSFEFGYFASEADIIAYLNQHIGDNYLEYVAVFGLAEDVSYTLVFSGLFTAIGSYSNAVGTYMLEINADGIEIETSDDETYILDLSSFYIEITPATITVELSGGNNIYQKVYGGEEIASYGYNIWLGTSTNGQLITEEDYDTYELTIGRFIRVLYNADGSFNRNGSIYDTVSSNLPAGMYYGIAVSSPFTVSTNYRISYSKLDEVRVVIVKRVIELENSKENTTFYGLNKQYDGSDSVKYSSGDMAIEYTKARSVDDVSIAYTAKYDSAETGIRRIIFSSIRLVGADSVNYELKIVRTINELGDEVYDGTGSVAYDEFGQKELVSVTTSLVVTITHINKNEAEPELIEITKHVLSITSMDIMVSKIYDGTVTADNDDVTVLRTYLATSGAPMKVLGGTLSQRNVGYDIVVQNLILEFEIARASNNFEGLSFDGSGVSIDIYSDKIVVTFAQIGGVTIHARTITLDQIVFSTASTTRRYNAMDSAELTYSFVEGALGEGDNTIALEIDAYFGQKVGGAIERKTNRGVWNVYLSDVVSLNSNYIVDTSNINEYNLSSLSITAEILPARLTLAAQFDEDRQYDGSSKAAILSEGKNMLMFFSDADSFITSDLESLRVGYASAKMTYDGKEQSFVVFTNEEKTNTALLNVRFDSIFVYAENIDVDINNYVIAAYVYEGGRYVLKEFDLNYSYIKILDENRYSYGYHEDENGFYVKELGGTSYEIIDVLNDLVAEGHAIYNETDNTITVETPGSIAITYYIGVKYSLDYYQDINGSYYLLNDGTYFELIFDGEGANVYAKHGDQFVLSELGTYFKYSDAVISNFELLEVAHLNRKVLSISTADVYINDKIYDGTNIGSGGLKKSDTGIISQDVDKVHVSFSVTFTGVDVGNNVMAYVRISEISNLSAAGSIDYAANYVLPENASLYAYGYAKILPAPLTFDIKLKDKIYDGTTKTTIESYLLSGLMARDAGGKYTLGATFGAFADKNVAESVLGTAYGLSLRYNGFTNVSMNYVLADKMSQASYIEKYGKDESFYNELPAEEKLKYVEVTVGGAKKYYLHPVYEFGLTVTESNYNNLSANDKLSYTSITVNGINVFYKIPAYEDGGIFYCERQENGVTYYYFSLKVKEFGIIAASSYSAENGEIYASYVNGGVTYYVVAAGQGSESVVYNYFEAATGRIVPKAVTVKIEIRDERPLTKTYDGTTKVITPEGIDLIAIKSGIVYLQNNSGNYLKVEGAFVEIKAENRYNSVYTPAPNGDYILIGSIYYILGMYPQRFSKGSYVEVEDGAYVYHNDEYIEIKEENLYFYTSEFYILGSDGNYYLLSDLLAAVTEGRAGRYREYIDAENNTPDENGNIIVLDGELVFNIADPVSGYLPSATGNYLKIGEDYIDFTLSVRYNFDPEKYFEDNAGNYICVDGEYYLVEESNRYNLSYVKNSSGSLLFVNGFYYEIVDENRYIESTQNNTESNAAFIISIEGMIDNENVGVDMDGLTVEFDSPTASTANNDRNIVFTVTALVGSGAGNYSYAGAIFRKSATIKKKEITVVVNNYEVPEGARNDSGIPSKIATYGSVNGITFDLLLTSDDGTTYIKSNNVWLRSVALGESLENAIEIDGVYYKEVVGTFSVPRVNYNATNLSNVGVYLVTLFGGDATNYRFTLKNDFSGTVQFNGNTTTINKTAAILFIQKATVYAYVLDQYNDPGNIYKVSKVYGGALPTVAFGYSATPFSDENGLKNGQSPSSILEPVYEFYLFNKYANNLNLAWDQKVTYNSIVTASLPSGMMYAVRIVAVPENTNYDVKIRYDELLSIYQSENGTIFDTDESGNTYLKLADYLDLLYISYAERTGISMSDFTKVYNGTSPTLTLKGVLQDDTITFKAYPMTVSGEIIYSEELSLNQVVNAGKYHVVATISRPNYEDKIVTCTVTINPMSFKLMLFRHEVNYDGYEHSITDANDIYVSIDAIDVRDIKVVYSLNGSVISGLPVDAGTYTVYAYYDPETATRTVNKQNYAYCKSDDVSLIINPIIVSISVTKKSVIYRPGESDLEFTKTISRDFEQFADYLDYVDIYVVYRDLSNGNEYYSVDFPGNYNYFIYCSDPNWRLVGDITGIYRVGVESATSTTESAYTVTANVKSGSVIYANTYFKSNIVSKAVNAQLNSEVSDYVSTLGSFFSPKKLSAIMDLSMYIQAGSSEDKVQPEGTVEITLQVPKSVGSNFDIYFITKEGTLKKVDYTMKNGKAVFETDELGYFVFVTNESFPYWFIGVIGGVVAIGVVVPVAIVVPKKKKLARAAKGAENAEGSSPEPEAEPVKDNAQEESEQ